MKKIKFLYPIVILLSLLSLQGCGTIENDEDSLVNRNWYWVKSEYYYPYNHHADFTEYPSNEDLSYTFYDNGDAVLKDRFITKLGIENVNIIRGNWDLWGDDLTIYTRDGDYKYVVESITSHRLILLSYDEYYERDDYGKRYLVKEEVRMFFDCD